MLVTCGRPFGMADVLADTNQPWQVKKNFKASLTIGASGSSGGEGPRNHIQGAGGAI